MRCVHALHWKYVAQGACSPFIPGFVVRLTASHVFLLRAALR